MKQTYLAPRIEAIALGTEQCVLTVSNGILSLLATTPPDNGIETLNGWDSNYSWE